MKNKRFRVGSIVILFAVVMLCTAIFGTLTVVTACRDRMTAEQYGSHIAQMNACRNEGQEWLAETDRCLRSGASLPEGTWEEDGRIGTEISSGAVRLSIELEKTDSGWRTARWSCTTDWQPDLSWTLWQ